MPPPLTFESSKAVDIVRHKCYQLHPKVPVVWNYNEKLLLDVVGLWKVEVKVGSCLHSVSFPSCTAVQQHRDLNRLIIIQTKNIFKPSLVGRSWVPTFR